MFNFGFTDEQAMLKKNARDFLDKKCPVTYVREIIANPPRLARSLWKEMASLGWIGLLIPEKYNGMEMGMVDLAILMEEIGKNLLPAPFLETIAAADAILQAGTEEQKQEFLPRIADGDIIATLAVDEPDCYWDLAGIQAVVEQTGINLKISGTKLFVPYADAADLIVVALRSKPPQDGITLVLVDPRTAGVSIEPLVIMDDTYNLCEINFSEAVVPAANILGQAGAGLPVLGKVLQRAALAASAEAVGGARKVLELAVDYSKERKQFDRPIGSFQAIKHQCADVLVDIESSSAVLYYAGWAVDNETAEAAQYVSSAKAYASDAYVNAAERAIQIHGAVGFTWEYDVHFYLKRARRLQMAFGDAPYHLEQIAKGWL